jgi:hypothetical protein
MNPAGDMSDEHSSQDILRDIDAEGHDAGVELESIGDDEITEPFDPTEIDVTTEARSLDTLLKRLGIGKIDLDPDFQRSRGIWNETKKSQLIESLLLRIPLPTFYVAEVPDDSGEDGWAVVDGIQRLSTIAEFVDPPLLDLSPLRLEGLQYLSQEEGKTFKELPQGLQLRILESQFTIQVIRKTTPEPVKLNIFARINTGGVPLSPQELRHALTPGPARAILKEFAEAPAFRRAVDDSVKPSRMADREMVLRFLAFRMEDPTEYRGPDFNEFLRASMKRINAWEREALNHHRYEFETTMNTCREIFGNDAFRKRYGRKDSRRPVSKALFEAVAVAVASVLEPDPEAVSSTLRARSGAIRRGFIELMSDSELERAISQGTGDPRRVRYRFGALLGFMSEQGNPG